MNTLKSKLSKWIKYLFIAILSLTILVYLFLVLAFKLSSSTVNFSKSAHAAVYAESKEPHKITLIDSGTLSIYQRLDLIKKAKKTIELEFFIFNIDQASRLVTQALLEKARQGVQVRLLVDFSFAVFQLRPAYAKLMEKAGIQIRYYNTSAIYSLISMQHRSHRKLLIIDGEKVLTGGRNIADEYFDLSKSYNFLDTDILLEGSLAKTIQSSFDLYWTSDLATDPEKIGEKLTADDLDSAEKFLELSSEDQQVLQKIKSIGEKEKLRSHTCLDTLFVSDFPGIGESHRKIYQTIVDLVGGAQKGLIIESPYFVLRDDGYTIFKKMAEQGLKN